MASYKEHSFQERMSRSQQAKNSALEKLKARPPVDEAVMAERRAAHEEKQRILGEQRAAKAAALAQARSDKAAALAAERAEKEAAEALKAARLAPPTAAEMKAARDARYAARKARK